MSMRWALFHQVVEVVADRFLDKFHRIVAQIAEDGLVGVEKTQGDQAFACPWETDAQALAGQSADVHVGIGAPGQDRLECALRLSFFTKSAAGKTGETSAIFPASNRAHSSS